MVRGPIRLGLGRLASLLVKFPDVGDILGRGTWTTVVYLWEKKR